MLLDLLDAYAATWPEDRERLAGFRAFVASHDDCFLRTCLPGHVTASAWAVSACRTRNLLVLHKKLGKWLQPGGHADGDGDTIAVALREVHEETGLQPRGVLPVRGHRAPLDIDVHEIPANASDPAHLHYDIRYLVDMGTNAMPVVSDESDDVRWFTAEGIGAVSDEEPLLRMARRSRAVLDERQETEA
jgi:8-oxo-dGTP pyrophosphatase MutT (NUDIX family)